MSTHRALRLALLALGIAAVPLCCRRVEKPDRSPEAVIALLSETRVWPRAAPPGPAAEPAADIHSLSVDTELGPASDGRWGYLVREIGGPTHYSVRVDQPFEPASTLKIVYLAHALRLVARGQASLSDSVAWHRGSTNPDDPATPSEDEREFGCPQDTDPAVGTLGDGLRAMMERSDNRWTLAVSRHFGMDAIRLAALDAGMPATLLRHRIGCAFTTDGDPGQVNAPNRSTLRELAGLVERVSTGELVGPDLAEVFFELMANDELIRLAVVFRQENLAAGLPVDVLQAVQGRVSLAWKTGKYNIGPYKCQSVVGRARFPVYQGEGKIAWRELVFAAFVDDATWFPKQGTRATLYSLAVVSELLRPAVAELLRSWRLALEEGARLARSPR